MGILTFIAELLEPFFTAEEIEHTTGNTCHDKHNVNERVAGILEW